MFGKGTAGHFKPGCAKDEIIVLLARILGFVAGWIAAVVVSVAVLYTLQVEAFTAAAIVCFAAGLGCARYAGRWAADRRGAGE